MCGRYIYIHAYSNQMRTNMYLIHLIYTHSHAYTIDTYIYIHITKQRADCPKTTEYGPIVHRHMDIYAVYIYIYIYICTNLYRYSTHIYIYICVYLFTLVPDFLVAPSIILHSRLKYCISCATTVRVRARKVGRFIQMVLTSRSI